MAEHYPTTPAPFPLSPGRSATLNGGDGGLTHDLWSDAIEDGIQAVITRETVVKFTWLKDPLGGEPLIGPHPFPAGAPVQVWMRSPTHIFPAVVTWTAGSAYVGIDTGLTLNLVNGTSYTVYVRQL